MNPILIVLPILTVLMFELGLTLDVNDFRILARHPRAVIAGMAGQLLFLPLIAWGLGCVFGLEPVYFIGLMLIACSPGGSSSNIFSMLAEGNVALSVSLTALSSVLTLFTIPIIMQLTTAAVGTGADISLPVGSLIVQNVLLMLVPIAAGIATRRLWRNAAERIDRVLAKTAFPALMLLAAIFFVQHHATIFSEFSELGSSVTSLILLAMGAGWGLAWIMRLGVRDRRTLVIEVGMQNAAQAIAVATSPFVFANDLMAIPAIIYALMMNVLLLLYVFAIRQKKTAGI